MPVLIVKHEQAMDVQTSFARLTQYCEKEGFKGWDPYDGLNSRFFQALPIIRSNRFCRLAWIQFFKKSPINFRPITGVGKDFNTKGLGLFLTGYSNLYLLEKQTGYLDKIIFLANKLLDLQSKGYSGSCWGYNFDWQARAFFQPRYTPTVVATSFVAEALLKAYEITHNKVYLETALSSTHFVMHDLNRTYDDKGNFSFSYSPNDYTQVFNASLLGARLLSHAYKYSRQEELKTVAGKAVAFACEKQQANGAWAYGSLPFHQWIDNFHTGFNLECIHDFGKHTGDTTFSSHVETGLRYYLKEFFTPVGVPKYYNNQLYPVDIHSPAQLVVTLSKLGKFHEHLPLIEKVMKWTIDHMQSQKGYFYYQKKRLFTSRIPYMRWSQAWMFYAFSYYCKELKMPV